MESVLSGKGAKLGPKKDAAPKVLEGYKRSTREECLTDFDFETELDLINACLAEFRNAESEEEREEVAASGLKFEFDASKYHITDKGQTDEVTTIDLEAVEISGVSMDSNGLLRIEFKGSIEFLKTIVEYLQRLERRRLKEEKESRSDESEEDSDYDTEEDYDDDSEEESDDET